MPTELPTAEMSPPVGASRWAVLISVISSLTHLSRRSLYWLAVTAAVIYFAFCALFLGLRYVVLPNIDHYKSTVASVASQMLNRPVEIAGISARWYGLMPNLQLDGVLIRDEHGEQALLLPRVNATISWSSVLGRIQLRSLEIVQPDLEIERGADGRLSVAGMLIDTGQPDDSRVLDWLLDQPEIVVRSGKLRWLDKQRGAPELTLSDISFVLRNGWRSHQAALRATPPAALAAPVDLRVEFSHPPFSRNRADVSRWSGKFYSDWREAHFDAWRPYLDLPWKLTGGEGGLRTWVSFEGGSIENVTADLAMKNVTVTLADGLLPLNLVEVGGRISVEESSTGLKSKWLSFGTKGHQIQLTDFSLRTDQGSVLPRTTASHHFIPATGIKRERHELKITQIDLDALSRLADHLPIAASERKLLGELGLRGQLKDFSANWEGVLPGEAAFKLRGSFEQLALQHRLASTEVAAASVLGFEGFSGDVDADQDGGRIKLKSESSTVQTANYLGAPAMSFEQLALDGDWSLRESRRILSIRVKRLDFQQAGLKGKLEGTHLLPWPLSPDKLGSVDMQANFPSVALNRVVNYLPAAIGRDAREWMSAGLLDGRAEDVNLKIRGDLNDFPFHTRSTGASSDSVFKLTARVKQGRLSPAPQMLAADRRTPLWPRIDDIDAQLTIDRSRLQIRADSAKTLGIPLSNVDVVIPDLMASAPHLDVNGNASASLPAMLTYVKATPVEGWIDHLTEDARTSGMARLILKMQIPLTDTGKASVQGNLKFSGNDIQLWPSLPTVSAVQGELGFSDHGFQISSLQGNALGGSVAISGGTQRDGSTQVRFEGSVTADGLGRFVTGSTAKRYLRRLSGGTRYVANVKIRDQRTDFSLDSSLVGLGIDLPVPLRKVGPENFPLRVTVTPSTMLDPATQSEEIRLTLGRNISARYLRTKPVSGNAGWKLVRGGIGMNAPIPSNDSGVALAINLPTLDADAWRNVLNSSSADTTPVIESTSPEQAYFLVDAISLRVNDLTFAERSFDNAVISANRIRGGWQLNLNMNEMSGRATWEDPSSERGAGKITARLTQLKIEERDRSDMSDLLAGKKSSTELPGLDVVADNFELRGLKLGRLELAATNGSLNAGPGREWRISKLTLTNPGATLRASGRWLASRNESQSFLNYEMDITDAGQLLDRLGFERTLRGGKGKMEGDLSWRGDPSQFDFPTLSGNLSLKLGSGQFLKADPGVAKLLGVMSLQSLPRRLTLDFRDIFSEGFAFDGIASTATISRGTLKTDSFKMRGPNAVVLMDGTVDLANETQNLTVVVIPELNAAGASVVYGLAVNPVVGLGAFLAQFFLKNPVAAVLTQDYQVTGPWKDPVIKKLPPRRKPNEPNTSP